MSQRDPDGNLVSTDRHHIGWVKGYFLIVTGVVLLAAWIALVWFGASLGLHRPYRGYSFALLGSSLGALSTGIWKIRDSARRNRDVGFDE